MSEPSKILLLYSMHSKNCIKLLETMPKELKQSIEIICIDGVKMRKILETSKVGIKSVPCLIITYIDNPAADIFENERVIDALMKLYEKIKPQNNTLSKTIILEEDIQTLLNDPIIVNENNNRSRERVRPEFAIGSGLNGYGRYNHIKEGEGHENMALSSWKEGNNKQKDDDKNIIIENIQNLEIQQGQDGVFGAINQEEIQSIHSNEKFELDSREITLNPKKKVDKTNIGDIVAEMERERNENI
jgi:hypothetical protein